MMSPAFVRVMTLDTHWAKAQLPEITCPEVLYEARKPSLSQKQNELARHHEDP